ncbi:abortive infection family protein [Aliivibrio fischeri]|uniref:abortive infection family protein n=1 Tax=Aliivibrio fischeri TaxID=668 RepID=UPI0007C5D952|nr:abortive infection family protein [Aliivibrio fischeri]
MSNIIPSSVVGAVASVIASHYFNHSKLNILFMEAGAPGEAPEGNCETKCAAWLKRCNDDPEIDALEVLGNVIQKYMEIEPTKSLFEERNIETPVTIGQSRIMNALEKKQLTYQSNGYVVKLGSSVATKTLEDYLKKGDFKSIEVEFERAISNITSDPHASITAASAIIEAVLKYYIEHNSLIMPTRMNIGPLWKTVRDDLSLNADVQFSEDQNKILTGMTTIIDGVGAFRSHIGSAHGRGITPPTISIHEARLAVNVAHCIVTYIMDVLGSCK